jgi:superfamily II DNA or RNA helicase
MVSIVITNTRCKIVGELHPEKEHQYAFHNMLREKCGYMVPNAEWSPAYKNNVWDGIISLYDKKTQSFPTGLLSNVLKSLKSQGCEYRLVDNRIKPDANIKIDTTFSDYGRSLYDYQINAVERAMSVTRGILALATGAGKTMTACELISRMSVSPVLFIVPSRSLLKQTQKEFVKYLKVEEKSAHVGMLGDGVFDINPNGVNVITYQTALAAFNEKFSESKNKIEVDELVGEGTKKTLEQLKAEFSFAEKAYNKAKAHASQHLSESSLHMEETEKQISLANDKEKKVLEKALSLLQKDFDKTFSNLIKNEITAYKKAKASLDTRLQSIENKRKIRELFSNAQAVIVDEAHLAAIVIEALTNHADRAYYRFGLSATPWREDNQEIRLEGCMGKKLVEVSPTFLIDRGFLVPPRIFMIPISYSEQEVVNYADSYTKHITKCWERNYRIKQFAEAFQEEGKPVMIIVDRIEHGNILEDMIKGSVFVPGSDKGEDDPDDEEQDYRKRMLDACERNEIILIGTQWLNTGIDAPAISVLVMAGSTQASATVLQTVGRVIRSHKESGKTEAVVIDFMDSDKHMRKHSLARKRVYESESGFDLRVIKKQVANTLLK